MLGIGFLADGQGGQGLNGIGAYIAGETTGQGVAGLFARGDPQQLIAQAVGLTALGIWGLAWGITLGIITRPRAIARSLIGRLTTQSVETERSAQTPEATVDPSASEPSIKRSAETPGDGRIAKRPKTEGNEEINEPIGVQGR
jgi:hypothetical protein